MCLASQLPGTLDHVPRRTASRTPFVDPTDMTCVYVAKKQLNQSSLSLVTVHQGCACRWGFLSMSWVDTCLAHN